MNKRSVVERATRIAVSAHATQVRKDDNTPYIVHPFLVALLLSRYDFSEDVIAAGLVHDVLEDTSVSEAFLREELGDEVVAIVTAVTNDDTLPWEEKKQKYIDTVETASEEAKAVATADKIQNAESLIAAHEKMGTELWGVFNTGKEKKLWFENAMLAMLQRSWNHPMVEDYATLVDVLNTLD